MYQERQILGSVENTMSRIRNSTGTKIAERILKLYLQFSDIEYS